MMKIFSILFSCLLIIGCSSGDVSETENIGTLQQEATYPPYEPVDECPEKFVCPGAIPGNTRIYISPNGGTKASCRTSGVSTTFTWPSTCQCVPDGPCSFQGMLYSCNATQLYCSGTP